MMDTLKTLAWFFPPTVWGLAAWMIFRQLRTWKKHQHDPDRREQNFRWNQFRRRLQISGSLVAAGIAAILLRVASGQDARIFFGSGLGLIAMWFVILTLSDHFITRKHIATMRDIKEVEGTSLPGDMRQRSKRDPGKLTLRLDDEPASPPAAGSDSEEQ